MYKIIENFIKKKKKKSSWTRFFPVTCTIRLLNNYVKPFQTINMTPTPHLDVQTHSTISTSVLQWSVITQQHSTLANNPTISSNPTTPTNTITTIIITPNSNVAQNVSFRPSMPFSPHWGIALQQCKLISATIICPSIVAVDLICFHNNVGKKQLSWQNGIKLSEFSTFSGHIALT